MRAELREVEGAELSVIEVEGGEGQTIIEIRRDTTPTLRRVVAEGYVVARRPGPPRARVPLNVPTA